MTRAKLPLVPRRALQGAFLATGAPLGWLAVRIFLGADPIDDLREQPLLYTYLLVTTMFAFSSFGAWLGRHEQQLKESSLTDSMTGLRNVRYFRARLRETLSEARRQNSSLALVIFDLDRFKGVNDRFGHVIGDRVLEAVGATILPLVRKGDTAARVGGEEFAVILSDMKAQEAIRAAERIRLAMGQLRIPTGIPARNLSITASAGIAISTHFPDLDSTGLYKEADRALYEAKRGGRNQIVSADETVIGVFGNKKKNLMPGGPRNIRLQTPLELSKIGSKGSGNAN